MTEEKKCLKCGGEMTEEFAMELPINTVPVTSRVEGKKKKSWWTKFKLINLGYNAITAYRCTNCGFLEMYAFTDEQEEKRYNQKKSFR